MTETRIRWEYADGGMDGYVGTLVPPAFRICDAAPASATWVLMAEFPGDAILGDDMDELKVTAERWLERFVASLGAVFPEPIADNDCPECGFGLPRHDKECSRARTVFADVIDAATFCVRYAPGRRVRYSRPGNGYPANQEMAARFLTLGEVYVIERADIGSASTRLLLAGIDTHGQGFNSVLFEPVEEG
jgi:hypothetical protein